MTGVTDANGNIITTYAYDAWGKIISVTGTQSATIGAANPFRYRGYYYDAETELYYLQSRYYNPEWGRFLNADDFQRLNKKPIILPFIVDTNTFAYGKNNPILYRDYNGRASKMNDFSMSIAAIIVWLGFKYIFTLFDTRIKIDSDIKPYKDSKKGCIKFNIETPIKVDNHSFIFSDILFDLYQTYDSWTFHFLASHVLERFYNEFPSAHYNAHDKDKINKRHFLFSLECVSNEIEQHCLAYWWAKGKIKFIDTSFMLWLGVRGKKDKTIEKCRVVDIFEQDVISLDDKTVFGYYNGIYDEYKKTNADPFYFPNLGTRSSLKVRDDWKTKIISY